MLQSIALILICGLVFSGITQKLKLPGLVGMIAAGIILGPHLLNLISPLILDISTDLREIALIVILARAGLALDINSLKKVGRPAILMCFIPATFEIAAVIIFAPVFLRISILEAAVMGTVLAAVSPAVIVPRMLKLSESVYGKRGIPQLLMLGASVDDIYVIVLFASFLGMHNGKGFDVLSLIKVPVSIITGLILGIAVGIMLVWLFKKIHMRDTIKIIVFFGAAFLFVSLEDILQNYIPLSGLLAIMSLGAVMLKKYEVLAKRLTVKFSKIWVGAELLLFVLVGAAVDISYTGNIGFGAVITILYALVIRMSGVFVCLLKTKFSIKEKLFCAVSYLPKATVQAAIGGIPLSIGMESGNIILAVAVLSILITAPLGAVIIDKTHKYLLEKDIYTHING